MDYVDIEMLSNWNLNDLTAAGKLLRKPPLPCQFDDEHVMRRVFAMIYDVYRCKLKLELDTREQKENIFPFNVILTPISNSHSESGFGF